MTAGGYFTTSYPNVVTYTGWSTPQLTEMFPTSGFASIKVNYYGAHRIQNLGDGRDLGDVLKLSLGNDLCSRFDIFQPYISSLYSYSYITCNAPSQQVAGKYNVT